MEPCKLVNAGFSTLLVQYNNQSKHPSEQSDISSIDVLCCLENKISRRGMPEEFAKLVEFDHYVMSKLQPIKVAADNSADNAFKLSRPEPEPDILKLLPVDPFGMGLSDPSH